METIDIIMLVLALTWLAAGALIIYLVCQHNKLLVKLEKDEDPVPYDDTQVYCEDYEEAFYNP